MRVNLRNVLISSKYLEEIAELYADVIVILQGTTEGEGKIFEADWVMTEFQNLRDEFWNHCAQTQDNLYDTSNALIHYINAVCEEDDTAAGRLDDSIDDLNDELKKDEKAFGSEIADDLDKPNTTKGEDAYDVPEHDPADRPEGD